MSAPLLSPQRALADRLRAAREAAGLTLDQLAERVAAGDPPRWDVALVRGVLGEIERGEGAPNGSRTVSLCVDLYNALPMFSAHRDHSAVWLLDLWLAAAGTIGVDVLKILTARPELCAVVRELALPPEQRRLRSRLRVLRRQSEAARAARDWAACESIERRLRPIERRLQRDYADNGVLLPDYREVPT